MSGASHGGCGGGQCSCGGHEAPQRTATVNGVALTAGNEQVAPQALRERAWSELLRQEAVRRQLLPAHVDGEAAGLSTGDRHVIEAMLDRAVPTPAASEDECRRFYDARLSQFVEGAQVHARHILFAVTAGVDVGKLAARAEQALLALTHQAAAPGRFAELARELSNCPSGANGGDLGWFGPRDCADELARELFHGQNRRSLGLRPRLVPSRYGFHIIDVLARRPGRQAAFGEVRERIALQLAQEARARALHQFMQLLAGQASIEGVTLAGAESPLVQ
jgi:peptidyl-prolyl cis-trans isomerase C